MNIGSVFVINLEDRHDRRVVMQKQLASIGWQAEFFPAIRPSDAANFPSIGARGCYLSQLAVLKKGRDARTQRLIILEDDVNFVSEFNDHWRTAMAALETKKWSMFYPGHVLDNLPSGLSLLAPATEVLCAHFVMINGSAIPIIIDGLETIMTRPSGHPLGSPMHVDGAYSTIRKHNPSLNTYIYSPSLGYQRPSRTDIGDLKWFDRVRALRPAVSFARRIRAISRAR